MLNEKVEVTTVIPQISLHNNLEREIMEIFKKYPTRRLVRVDIINDSDLYLYFGEEIPSYHPKNRVIQVSKKKNESVQIYKKRLENERQSHLSTRWEEFGVYDTPKVWLVFLRGY